MAYLVPYREVNGCRGRDGVGMPRGLLLLKTKTGTGFHKFTFIGEF